MIINPIKLRDNGFSDEMIRYFMDVQYDPDLPMGNIAISKIEKCVYGVIVGRYECVSPILPEAVRWIDLALSRKEEFGKNLHFYRSRLCHARGIASWLMDDLIHEDDWNQARISGEAAWSFADRVWTRHEIVSEGALDDYMACAWLAGPDHWEAGVEMYEHWMGGQGKLSLSGKLSPKKYVYAILRDATGRQRLSQDKLFAAGRGLLRANLQENWFGSGQGVRAATWLKIVYGLSEPDLSANQTLLRAYDDMPDVMSPF